MSKAEEFFEPAEDLYVKEGRTLGHISGVIGVSTTTLTKWKKEGDWARKRKDFLTRTRTGPVQKLREALLKLLDDTDDIAELTGKKADTISKLVAVIEKIEGGRDVLGSTIEVMDRFTRYVKDNEPDDAFTDRLVELMQGFFNTVKRG